MKIRGLGLAAALLLATGLTGCGGSKDKSTDPTPGPLVLSADLTASGGQYEHRFADVGSYPYHCRIHPTMMTGIVTVSASAPAGDSLQTVVVVGLSFSPTSIVIPVGGKVTWTNPTASLHSVTSD